jgi:hypothetical protein
MAFATERAVTLALTAVIGEIDFVILAPSGRVLLVEQKSGFLTEKPMTAWSSATR